MSPSANVRVATRLPISRSSHLMMSTALGCSLMVMAAAAPAMAQNQCGAAVPGGTVTCAAAGSPYAGGVSYSGVNGLTVNVAANTTISTTTANALSISGTGITVNAGPGSIETNGANRHGVVISSTGPATTEVDILGSITTRGQESYGLDIQASGLLNINVAGPITATGTNGYGGFIMARSVIGDFADVQGLAISYNTTATVNIDNVTTSRIGSPGLQVAGSGNQVVNFESVSTAARESDGLRLFTTFGGSVTFTGGTLDANGQRVGGNVTTNGQQANGLELSTAEINGQRADITGRMGNITTLGVNSTALLASGGNVDLVLGAVTTGQADSAGLSVTATGTAQVTTGAINTRGKGITIGAQGSGILNYASISTVGATSYGMVVSSADGSFNVTGGDITTSGGNATGANIAASGDAALGLGNVTARLGNVSTNGGLANGVILFGMGDVVAQVGTITAAGTNSSGLIADALGGTINATTGAINVSNRGALVRADADLSLTTGDVTTRTIDANGAGIGIEARSTAGDITVVGGNVITAGGQAYGAYAVGTRDTNLTLASITTGGQDAHGVYAEGGGDLTATVTGAVTTSGTDAFGLFAADVGDVIFNAGSISTTGVGARGVNIDRDPALTLPADVTVTVAGAITTNGTDADGAFIRNNGHTTINAASVTTGGTNSDGIYVDGGGVGEVDVTVTGAVTTGGDNTVAVRVIDAEDVDLRLGSVATSGDSGGGISVGYTGAFSGADRVVIDVGTVATTGFGSEAITVAAEGDVAITTGLVTTEGQASGGIRVDTGGDIVIDSDGVSTLLNGSTAIYAFSTAGDVSITTGDVSAVAAGSRGIDARAGEGGDITVVAADVTSRATAISAVVEGTSGSANIVVEDVVTSGADAPGVAAFGAGNINLTYQSVTTSGDRSRGLSLESTGGTVTVLGGVSAGSGRTGGDITTQGAFAHGASLSAGTELFARFGDITTRGDGATGISAGSLSAAGGVDIRVDSVTTSGASATGIDITSVGDVALVLGRVETSGANANGVNASGTDVTLAVSQQIQATGYGAFLRSRDQASVSIATNAGVTGGAAALFVEAITGTSVTNAGTLSSTNFLALDIDGGSATVVNSGNIVGRVDLTGNADTLTNSGTFRMRGNSDFGAGTDLFTNTGVVTLADSTTPLQAGFLNLERFANSGLLDLANGVAGDVVTFGGAFANLAGGRVEMDLDLRATGPVSDQLIVGSVDGPLQVQLQVMGAGQLGDTGVTLVRSGIDQAGTEVDVRAIGGGFLDFDTEYAAGTREFRLVARKAVAAFEPTKVASGAQTQWRRSADVISARFDDLRDAADMGLERGDRAQFWGQAFSGSEEVANQRMLDTGGGRIEAVNLSHEVDTSGIQFGGDVSTRLAGGDLVVGLAASLGKTELTFQSNGDTSTFDGVGLGAYAQWTLGNLSVGGLVKADFYDLEYRWDSADLEDEATGDTFGGRVDAAWRMPMGQGWAVEPQASLAWTETELNGIQDDAGRVEFGDTRSVLGKVGLRMSRVVQLSNGGAIQPFIGLHRLNEFDGENASRIVLERETFDVVDETVGGWNQISLGANFGIGAIQGFVQGESLHGDVDGYAVRVGARLNW